MSLFFDKEWFEAKLATLGLDRAVLGAAAGLDAEALDAVFKDQREVSPAEVAAFARLLATDAREVAQRCGVSTVEPSGRDPWRAAPASANTEAEFARLHARIDRLERLMLEVLDRLAPPLP
jgi:hypothetical protein